MDRQLENKQPYPFTWLDELAEVTLNPETTGTSRVKAEELKAICERLPEEISRISLSMKNQAFSLYSSEHIKIMAGQYDQAIGLLQQQARNNLARYPESGALRDTGEVLLSGLNELAQRVRRRYRSYLPDPPAGDAEIAGIATGTPARILLALSADQLGILVRSAFDAKLIAGNSFRKVCQTIAPFLSTPWKSSISWDTIRSNSGRPETRDKDIAIGTLEKMIEKIRGYG